MPLECQGVHGAAYQEIITGKASVHANMYTFMDVPYFRFRLDLSDGETCEASEREQRGEYTYRGGHPERNTSPSLPDEASVGARAAALLVLDASQFGRRTGHGCEPPDTNHVRVKETRQRRLGAP